MSFCDSDESKSGLARDPDGRLQSRNLPFGTSDDLLKYFRDVRLQRDVFYFVCSRLFFKWRRFIVTRKMALAISPHI